MDILKKIIKVKPTVYDVLKHNHEARDSDNILIIAVWEIQAKVSKTNLSTYNSFVENLLSGKLSTPSSIIRCRCKLQEDYEELRGLLYDERKYQEKIIKNQMKLDF